MKIPTLYQKSSTGKIKQWGISVRDEPVAFGGSGRAVIEVLHGQHGGKMQVDHTSITEGKNIGKSNETTPFEQACADAKSKWDAKKLKGYVESLSDALAGNVDASVVLGGIDPMLAHKFSEQGHKITYPCFAQPKLDGHRCIAIVKDGVCTLWSRRRKQIFGVPHIARAIEALNLGDVILDGELYVHGTRIEKLASFIRQTTPKPGHEVIEYHIYDTVNDSPFVMRNDQLKGSIPSEGDNSPLSYVPTMRVEDEDHLIEMFRGFLSEDYEGLMVRNMESKYVQKRSYDLQKVKEFDDAEFEVVDVIEGVGRLAGCGIFVCTTPSGFEFKCKMKGELDTLRPVWDNKDTYIGRTLTVQYQGITGKNGVPRFPIGIRLREDV